MPFIDVADRDDTGSGVIEVVASHPAYANYRFGKLITGGQESLPQDVAGNNSKGREGCCRPFEKIPSRV